jgi:hypothetical protein
MRGAVAFMEAGMKRFFQTIENFSGRRHERFFFCVLEKIHMILAHLFDVPELIFNLRNFHFHEAPLEAFILGVPGEGRNSISPEEAPL